MNSDPQVLPSLLYFSRYGWQRVGRAAVQAYQEDPDGRFVRALKSALPEYSPDDRFRMFQKTYTLPSLLQLVFERIQQRLQSLVGAPVTQATVGRPVRFSPDAEIDRRTEQMLRTAAEGAGFSTIRFLSEPEAATRYFFSRDQSAPEATVLVFDFGGGTLDLCLAHWAHGSYEVLATSGVSIGGTLLDRVLFEQKLLKHLGKGQTWGRGLELPNSLFNRLVNPDAAWRVSETEYSQEVRQILHASNAWGSASTQLKTLHEVVSRRLGPSLFGAIEQAKVRLSDAPQTEIRFRVGDTPIVEPLTRAELWDLFSEQLEAIRGLIEQTLAQAGHAPRDVDRVILAGGSSGLVCIQELLSQIFGSERVPLRQDLFTSIVSGLALDAASTP